MKILATANRLVLFFVLMWHVPAHAQVDTISVKKNNLRTVNLTEGKSQYLNWLKDNSGVVSNISVSERTISFRKINGESVIVITKKTFNNDTTQNRFVSVTSVRRDFKTLYVYYRKSKTIESYNFPNELIKGADSVKENTRADFYLKFDGLPYCNEIDLETISAVPIKKIGQQMAIKFYQPGNHALSGFLLLKVLKAERLRGVNKANTNCWVLKLVFTGEWYDLFWVSKNTHELLKFESWDKDGCYSKVKLFATGQHF